MLVNIILLMTIGVAVLSGIWSLARRAPEVWRGEVTGPRWGAGPSGAPITRFGMISGSIALGLPFFTLIAISFFNLQLSVAFYEIFGIALASLLVLGILFDHVIWIIRK